MLETSKLGVPAALAPLEIPRLWKRAANTADNSTLYAPLLMLGLQRIGWDSPKSAALIH